ncbi:MAG: acetylxylan esterase [Clostridia bacterium]|nr:acetylxylan esterase [Clostridia bacterium]
MIEIRGDLCHQLLKEKVKPVLSFDENKDYAAWKEEVKEKFLDLVGIENIRRNACPLRWEIESEEQKEGYKLIRFVFESERGAFVPCYLCIPDTGKEKYPLAITLQGHSTGFHNSIGVVKYEGDESYKPRGEFALQAVKNGYAALAIEQRGMGERRPVAEHQVGAHMCEYEAHIALLLGRTILGERIWDVSKAIDLLPNFPEIDSEKIFITGSSGGGTASFYAACLDERIKLAAPNCAFCTYKASIMNYYHCSCNFIPHSFENFEMQDLTCLIAPRPLVVTAGREDRIFPLYGVREGFETVKRIYQKAGVPENCRLVETPKAHYWCKDLVWDAINQACEKLGWR